MNYTKAQENAIGLRDCSLLVSAGAGSGKTAVLTERILERICDKNDDCSITDFLIVTFTNAAAKELSDRIRKKLSARGSEDPTNKKIVKNLALLPLAKISTINAFCYELVRNNFQKLNLSANLRIADEAEMGVIREKLMNETIDDAFETRGDSKSFLAAYEIFSSAKNDKGFVTALLDVDAKLRSLADREGFVGTLLENYSEIQQKDEFFDTFLGALLEKRTRKDTLSLCETFEKLCEVCRRDEVLAVKYLPAVENELDFAKSVLQALDKGYESTRKAFAAYSPVKLGTVKNFEDEALKELVKEIKNNKSKKFRQDYTALYACDMTLLKKAAADTRLVLEEIVRLLTEFDARLCEKKRESGMIEFSDAEKYTLELLVESTQPFKVTELAKKLREQFLEIYIDEYQDVNPMQDMIFKALSRHNDSQEEYSRFMVGDIKQSIYRFRGASPDIFMNYRDSFGDADGDSVTKRIFMNDNFRCSQSVIELTNFLFRRLMGEYYLKEDELKHSRIEKNKVTQKAQLCTYTYDKELAEGLSAEELEAGIIGTKIKKFVNNPEYTDSDGKMYKYSDVAVLCRSKTALRVYEKVLSECGIPVMSDVGESFYGKKEILLCLCILNSIDNPERDIYLAGYMRSFAGGFSDDELALIKKDYRRLSLYRSVVKYSQEKTQDNAELSKKCSDFVEKLRAYREFSRGKSVEKLVWKIYGELDLLGICTSENFGLSGQSAKKNLLKLYEMARSFSKTSFRGVGAFVDYINGSMEKTDIKAERVLSGECVSLMTIHASKGLEFPICFVSDLARRFNKSDETAKLVFSEKAGGAAVTLCDTEAVSVTQSSSGMLSINTPYRKLIASYLDDEGIAEEIRVLYVALTRARDILVMTSGFTKKLEGILKDARCASFALDVNDGSSFCALLMSCLCNERILACLYDKAESGFVPTEDNVSEYLCFELCECEQAVEGFKELYCGTQSKKEETKTEGVADERELDSLRSIGQFEYAGAKTINLPAKLTVSRLKTGLLDEENLVVQKKKETEEKAVVPRFIQGESEADGAEKGTAMHMFMQFCDFEGCEKEGCERWADRLCELGFIDSRQRELLDINRLSGFFKSEFYTRIKNSKNIYRERRFNLEVDVFKNEDNDLEKISGMGILVQGVIDLFFENDDGTYTLVDFKTDRVFGEGAEQILIDRHKEQLTYYKRALEEMTGKKVRDTYIYSFSLMKEISVY